MLEVSCVCFQWLGVLDSCGCRILPVRMLRWAEELSGGSSHLTGYERSCHGAPHTSLDRRGTGLGSSHLIGQGEPEKILNVPNRKSQMDGFVSSERLSSLSNSQPEWLSPPPNTITVHLFLVFQTLLFIYYLGKNTSIYSRLFTLLLKKPNIKRNSSGDTRRRQAVQYKIYSKKPKFDSNLEHFKCE